MKATSRAPRIIGRIFKTILALLIVAINTVIVWRVFFSANIPDAISSLTVTEKTQAAYAQHGDGLILQYQDQASVTKGQKDYGYFGAPQVIFIPQAEQVQLVFRYNNSTLKHLAEDYKLPETPDKSGHLFDVTLALTTDLTPENTADNTDPSTLAVTRYRATEAHTLREETQLYTYYRYVFDGVRVDELTVAVFADVYYMQDVQYENEAYGRLCLYSNDQAWLPYELPSADRKKLAQA